MDVLKAREDEIYDVLGEYFPLFANGGSAEVEKKKRQYAKILQSFTVEELRAILQYCVMRQNFIPTLYEIKLAKDDIAAAAAEYHVPTADEALAEVYAAAAKSEKKPRFSHAAIDYAVSILGWHKIMCTPSTEAEYIRASWRRIYDTYLRRAEREEAAKNVLWHMSRGAGGLLRHTIEQLSSAKEAALPSAASPPDSP